jgi:hypothetical protein
VRSRRHDQVVIPEPLPEANSPPNVREPPLGLQIYVEAVGMPKLEAGLGMALVWLGGGLEVALGWLWCGLGVALYSGVYA